MARIAFSPRGHSRLVAVLKLVLPLCALVLLSLVFLLARPIDPNQAIELAEIDVEERARDPRLSGARFAGVTDDGTALLLVTETARSDPDATLRFAVTGLELRLDGARGERVVARADAGAVDRGVGTFDMSGGVEIIAEPGYRLHAERVTGALDISRIEVPAPLVGQAPAGELSAGNLLVTAVSGSERGYVLVFGGGVRLIYQPGD